MSLLPYFPFPRSIEFSFKEKQKKNHQEHRKRYSIVSLKSLKEEENG